VYAIWLPMLPGDSRGEWDKSVLGDPRVVQFWDGQRVVGRWLADRHNIDIGYPGPVVWDAFLLFNREARWGRPPTNLLTSGFPVIGDSANLKARLTPLL